MRYLLVVALLACSVTAPQEAGAHRITPPAALLPLWEQVEQCSGAVRPMTDIDFYEIPGALTFEHKGSEVGGYYRPPNQIVMGEDTYYLDSAVRHEFLHAILRTVDHPHQFTVECQSIVTPP